MIGCALKARLLLGETLLCVATRASIFDQPVLPGQRAQGWPAIGFTGIRRHCHRGRVRRRLALVHLQLYAVRRAPFDAPPARRFPPVRGSSSASAIRGAGSLEAHDKHAAARSISAWRSAARSPAALAARSARARTASGAAPRSSSSSSWRQSSCSVSSTCLRIEPQPCRRGGQQAWFVWAGAPPARGWPTVGPRVTNTNWRPVARAGPVRDRCGRVRDLAGTRSPAPPACAHQRRGRRSHRRRDLRAQARGKPVAKSRPG